MKKILFVVLFVVLFFPLASSTEVQMKEDFERGETLVAKISGSFEKPPQESNIRFERNGGYVPFDKNLVKFSEGEYFLSAIVPTDRTPGNYTMTIEDVEYAIPGDRTSSDDITKGFEVLDSYAVFSVDPAVLESKKGEFSLELENLNAKEITIDANTQGTSRTFEDDSNESWSFSSWFGSDSDSGTEKENESYSPERSIDLDSTGTDDKKTVKFDFGNVDKGIQTMSLSTKEFGQEIFVYVSQENNNSENTKQNSSNYKNESSMEFEKGPLKINMSSNASISETLGLRNTGDKDLRDVELELKNSGNEIIEHLNFTDYIAILEVNETDEVKLNISSPQSVNGTRKLGGMIKASSKNETSNKTIKEFLSLSINFVESYSQDQVDFGSNESSNTSSSGGLKLCADMNGTVCEPDEDEKCKDGNTEEARNGVCCLSECVVEEEGTSTGAIVGWIIIGLLVVLFIWFYMKKYKKTKNKPSLDKYTNGSNKK